MLIGVGISNAEQAREVVAIADGVVVGSALVHRLLSGAGPERCGGIRGGAAGGDRPLSSAPGGIFFRGLKGARTVGYPVLIESPGVLGEAGRAPPASPGVKIVVSSLRERGDSSDRAGRATDRVGDGPRCSGHPRAYEAFRSACGRGRARSAHPRWLDHRFRGPERRREDHHDPDAVGPDAPHGRERHGAGPSSRPFARVPARVSVP